MFRELAPLEEYRKFERVLDRLSRFSGVAVAFSGGVDSTLALIAALKALGPHRVLAVTALLPVSVPGEVEGAKGVADWLGVRHEVVEVDVMGIPEFRRNLEDRCYYCKREIYRALKDFASSEGYSVLIDGSRREDFEVGRPGIKAARELGVLSPLAEVGIGREDVRKLLKFFGAPNADKPPESCLATRIPLGEEITEKKLRLIAHLENAVKDFADVSLVRARLRKGKEVVIEVFKEDIPKLVECREDLLKAAEEIGVKKIYIDLRGYVMEEHRLQEVA